MVLVLIGIGVTASIGRVMFPADMIQHAETARAAIRRGDVARHRERMIRMFGNVLAISTVRLVGGPIEFVLTPYGVPPAHRFVLAIWAAWLLTLGAAECWIRYTRPRDARELDFSRSALPL